MEEYTNISHRNQPKQFEQRDEINSTHWTRPEKGWIKCNYDGSFVNASTLVQTGWIIRDERGIYLGSGQAKGFNNSTALESEFQALLIAMQNCWVKGYSRVIFEGDCKSLVDLLNKKTLNFGMYNWVREVSYWKNRFEGVQFKWVKRNNNQPADILAKHPLRDELSSVFHYFVPKAIDNALFCDFSGLVD